MRKLDQSLNKLHNYINAKELFPGGARLMLAISGGSDSVALLCLFSRLRSLMHVTLLAVHINHGLRGSESDADESLTRELCLRHNVPLIVRRLDLKPGADLENRARGARFAIFEKLLKLYQFDLVVLGHHRDDQAETMLMNLIRGAGIGGLAGIKPLSGKVVHPLLDFGKEELRELLREEGLAWREDASNADPGYRRNHIRSELIPQLTRDYNPRVVERLAAQAEVLADADKLLRAMARTHLKRVSLEQSPDRVVLDISALNKLSRSEQYYVLKLAYSALAGTEADFWAHSFSGVMALLSGGGTKLSRLRHGIGVTRQYNELILHRDTLELTEPEPLQVEEDRARAVYLDYRYSFRYLKVLPRPAYMDHNSVIIDADKISYPFTIRVRRPGDRFIPTGMTHSKKLKDYFIDAKVPRERRGMIPLFDDGEKIFWITGLRADARVAPDEHSNRYLQITAEAVNEKPKRAASRIKNQGVNNEPDELRYFGSTV